MKLELHFPWGRTVSEPRTPATVDKYSKSRKGSCKRQSVAIVIPRVDQYISTPFKTLITITLTAIVASRRKEVTSKLNQSPLLYIPEGTRHRMHTLAFDNSSEYQESFML